MEEGRIDVSARLTGGIYSPRSAQPPVRSFPGHRYLDKLRAGRSVRVPSPMVWTRGGAVRKGGSDSDKHLIPPFLTPPSLKMCKGRPLSRCAFWKHSSAARRTRPREVVDLQGELKRGRGGGREAGLGGGG